MKTFLLLLMMAVVGVHTAVAQYDYGFTFSKAGSAGFQSLKIGLGAREVAMGEAAASITNSATAVFWNPAGLAFVEDRQVHFFHTQWLNGSRQDAVVFAMPIGSYVIGLSAVRFGIEEFEETTVQNPEGTGHMVSAGDLVLGLAASRRFSDRLTIGLQLKYIRENLDETAFDDLLFDVGAIYYTGFHNLRLAFALQHFGPDKKILRQSFRTPLLFRVSAGEDLILTNEHRLTTAVDLVHPTDNNEWVNAGLEYEFLKMFAVRGGYRFNVDAGNITAGGGVKIPEVSGLRFTLDYAFAQFGDLLGATHRLTLACGF